MWTPGNAGNIFLQTILILNNKIVFTNNRLKIYEINIPLILTIYVNQSNELKYYRCEQRQPIGKFLDAMQYIVYNCFSSLWN